MLELSNFRRETNLGAPGADFSSEGPCHGRKINDALLRYSNGLDPGGVWLELANPLRPDNLQSLEAVRSSPLVEVVESRNLLARCGDDNLSANLEWNTMPLAELDHPANSLHRQMRLTGARLVVEAAVQDSAVIACLVPARTILLFEKKQVDGRITLKELVSRRKSNNPSAHDCDFHMSF